MKCNEVEFGKMECSYTIMLPYYVGERETKMVNIDKCLLEDVISIWKLGIKTTGCCCGHGKVEPFISVKSEYIQKMLDNGYTQIPSAITKGREDIFFPKRVIRDEQVRHRLFHDMIVEAGDADHGFNWWDYN